MHHLFCQAVFFGAAAAWLLLPLSFVELGSLEEPQDMPALSPVLEFTVPRNSLAYWLMLELYFLSFFLAAFGFLYSVWINPFRQIEVPNLQRAIEKRRHLMQGKLFFRCITKGNNPVLVCETVRSAEHALRNVPVDLWTIEVVTDKAHGSIEAANVMEIVTPKNYQTPNGAKYKARSLHYAVQHSKAEVCDWIVHLDEETQFNETTVCHMLHHCNKQDEMLKVCKTKKHGNIAQGVILFGTGKIENWMTTLMDSFRVGYDHGLVRWQYEQNDVWVGMHGSFFLVPNSVEMQVGFDGGPTKSITEDTYFAFKAAGEGVRFNFIEGEMFEESPFSLRDFIWQRERWARGLIFLLFCSELPLSKRLFLGYFILMWLTSGCTAVFSLFVTFQFSDGIIAFLTLLTCFFSIWPYLLGFALQYQSSDGVFRYGLVAIGQVLVIPIGMLSEGIASILGLGYVLKSILIDDDNGFYVVKKRNSAEIHKKKNRTKVALDTSAADADLLLEEGTMGFKYNRGRRR